MKPKKLIRTELAKKLPPHEVEIIESREELNKLYALKILEERAEIVASDHKDVNEFVDLIQATFQWARLNGFYDEILIDAMEVKSTDKGVFLDVALNNLNPDNPSNKIYFENEKPKSKIILL